MKEKENLYFSAELLAAALSLLFLSERKNVTFCVLTGLLFACAFSAKLISQRMRASQRISQFLCAACVAGCFFIGMELMFPLLAVLAAELTDQLAGQFFYPVFLTLILLFWLIYPCNAILAAVTISVLIPLLFARVLCQRLSQCRDLLEQRQDETDDLRERLNDNRNILKARQYAARLEERNRLAARIHDKIGHGVSGSIILLEAALLTMERNPAASREVVEKAVENLRQSVDDIRLSLRDERPVQNEAGFGEIEAELARFSDMHGIRTLLKKSGALEQVPGPVWNCLYENMKEALTNFLKHSRASLFTVKLSVANHVLRAEFRDNGCVQTKIKRGMGLDNMEERVTNNGGKCFIESGEAGFSILQLFPLH